MISSVFYFLYFAAVGIYAPYWVLYLQHLQLTSLQIATVYSIPSIARFFFPLLYGYLADRWQARRTILILATWGQVLPLFFVPVFHSYGWLLFLMSIFSIFGAAILPFAEATTQEEQEKGMLDYGRTRLWGTISFILAAIFFGKLLDKVEDIWILYGFLFFLILLSLVSFIMPAGKMGKEFRHKEIRQVLVKRSTWIFLCCIFLMQVSHGAFYGFYSIYLAELGVHDSGIGLQWAISAASEFSIFFFASRILGSFRSGASFSVCLLIAALRWTLTGSTASYFWLSVWQCLHAFTFGLFHITCMRLIHRIFPEGFRSFGQSLYSSIGGGLGSFTGVVLCGYLWDIQGAKVFWTSGCLALIAFFLSLLSKKMHSNQDQPGK